ncbi:hypothetical protein PFICI_03012 [Pestalotiopsis fici W106-1]|uniref:Uncharacterized protein n=1 Tax=Pestalotiopsis fici (strain W106-1 / CGMCC3.15140) TaxID=1229662 RepID=W3XHR7_PESFW|nr:uncharacterized protein PFICI_03012 [Pestalotiopsis fici W106-1]ETS84987.1 hypothetical protein PFICI_03012 [Pestalotiopsis fici W106-1]
MRFSTSSILAAVLCTTAVTAQVAGLNKLTADVTKFLGDLTSANIVAASGDLLIVVNDVKVLGQGAGGLGSIGAGTTPAVGTAFVNQVVNTVCPALVNLENSIPDLPFPVNLLTATATGAVRAIINTILASLRALPTPVDTTPAVTCLNAVVSSATKRDTVEPIPVAFAA